MAPTRFVVQGRCPGLVLPYDADDAAPSFTNTFESASSPGKENDSWRFSAGQPGRNSLQHISFLCSSPRAHTGGSWSPRMAHETTASVIPPKDAALQAPAGPGGPPECDCSVLQRHALLQLLGPSIGMGHATGPSLVTNAARGLAAMFMPQQYDTGGHCQSDVKQSCIRQLAGSHAERAFVAPGVERPLQLTQLHAACLASVASALVLLPRVWGEQGQWQALAGLSMGSGNPNLRLNHSVPQTPTTTPQLQQQQRASQGPRMGAATERAASETAASVTTDLPSQGFSLGGRLAAPLPSSALSPAALVLAVSPAAGSAAPTTLSMEEALGGPAMAEPAQSFRGSSSTGTSSFREAAAVHRRSVHSAVAGSERSTTAVMNVEVEVETEATMAGLGAEEAKDVARKAERPKIFDNPLRYCKLLFAGAMSAVVSRTCVAPLERVKMDLLLKNGTGDAFTTAAQVLRTEGIAGFWKGNALNVLRTAPFKAVNFFSFDMYHTAFLALSGRDENLERFLAGACAGVTATLVCFPLDVVRTRLMASVAGPRYGSGPFSTLAGILRNEGAAALYSGCLPAVIGMAPAGAVFYGVYDLLKHRHLESLAAGSSGGNVQGAGSGQVELAAAAGAGAAAAGTASAVDAQKPLTLDPMRTLLYGAMAGAASELIVYPLEVIRRKMQLQSMAAANMRLIGGMHPHHHPHLPHLGPPGAASPAAAAAGGRLAAAAYHHYHMLPYQLGAQKMIATLSAAAVANSPGLARVSAAVSAILTADGPRGFYSGLLPNMLQVLPSAALSYYTYDTLKTALGAR